MKSAHIRQIIYTYIVNNMRQVLPTVVPAKQHPHVSNI